MTSSRSMESLGSMLSIYSAMGGKGNYNITGRVKIGVWYKNEVVYARVVRAEGLAGAKSGGISDPYVKTYLLPDRSKMTKRKTGIQRKTTNPEYNEVLKTKLYNSDLASCTLWLSVWDWDRYGRNQFLGEVRLPLSTLDLTDPKDYWYTLQDQQYQEDNTYRGKLRIAIKFSPSHKSSRQGKKGRKKVVGSLFVSVKEADDLPQMDPYSLTDATVKLYLLPNRSSSSKKKTSIITNNLSPTWNEDFEFKFVNLKELRTCRVLEATVWDYDRRGSNEFIGGLRLGPMPGSNRNTSEEWMDAIGEEVNHWEEALSHPGEWISRWHNLRSSMTSLKHVGSRGVGVLSPVKEITSNYSNPQSPVPAEAGYSAIEIPAQTPTLTSPQSASTPPPPPSTVPVPDEDEVHDHEDDVCNDKVQQQEPNLPVVEEILSSLESKESTPIPQIFISDSECVSMKGTLEEGFGSVANLWKGDYDIAGEVLLDIQYKDSELLVYVASARGLAAADSNGLSDPYIKTYLLPDKGKHSKKKTAVKKKTLNPVYKETLKYKVEESEFRSRTLWLSVWDWDRLGKNKFLGEIRLPLSTINFKDNVGEHWYQLKEKDDLGQAVSSHSVSFNHGELRLGLMFTPTETKSDKGILHIHMKNAQNLPNMDEKGLTDGFVKLYLLPDKSSKGKRKTAVKKNNLNPIWDEQFTYEKVSLEELSTERVLEVTVWDYDKASRNEFVGGVRLGPALHRVKRHKGYIDSNNEEASHWEEALAHPGKWVECSHTLRSSMDPREIDLSSIPALLSMEDNFQRESGEEEEEREGVFNINGVSNLISPSPAQESEQEFKLISVSQFKSTSPPDQDAKIVSIRKHPEVIAKQDVSLNKNDKPSSPPLHIKLSELSMDQTKAAPLETTSSSHSTPTPDPIPFPQNTELPSTSSAPKELDKESNPLQDAPSVSPPPPPTSKSLLRHLKLQGSSSTLGSTVSFGSMTSLYSAAGGKGDYDITGEVLFGMTHVNDQLLVNVNRARNLAAVDKRGYSNPYVKTYLLPDRTKDSKRKTSVKKKTVNPVYGETLKTKLYSSDLARRTLWLSVCDWDRYGRNQFLGEVRLPLLSFDLTDSKDRWYTLQDKDENGGVDEFVRGEVNVGLMFKPSTSSLDKKGTLNVVIKEARDLPPINSNGLVDAAVKSYLLPDRSSSGKRKTGVIKNNLNPVFEEKFVFEHVTQNELLKDRVLELTVWDCDRRSNDFIGGLRVGGAPGRSSHPHEWMDSIGLEVSHWERMLSQPGEWTEEWHTLRPSMNPREVDLSKAPPPGSFILPSEQIPMPIKRPPSPLSPLSQTLSAESSASIVEGKDKTEREEEVLISSAIASIPSDVSPRSIPVPGSVEFSKPHITESALSSRQDSRGLISMDESKKEMPFAKNKGLLGLSTSDSVASFGSTASIYSAAGGKGDYDITGEVLVGIHFKSGQLVVHVNRARGLAAADSNGLSDPYIKTYLLPDKSKHSKKKTDIKKKTLNPVYDYTIKYKVPQSDLASRTLWLSVWDWDRFGRNQFLGEVRLPLSTLDLSDSTDQWYPLLDKDSNEDEGDTYRGQLSMAVMFEQVSSKRGKVKGILHVAIKKAKDLCNQTSNAATTDSFVKFYLLPDKGSSGKRKTSVIRNTSNPIWEETFTYEKLDLDELANDRVLEVVVWDLNKGSSNEFIGGLRLGPAPKVGVKHKEWMDSIGEEVSHWESVMTHPGEWIEVWHTLRTTMDCRSVSLE